MCDKCKKIKCGCVSTELCGCSLQLPMGCTHYNGIKLETLGIEPGMDGNMVIKIINDYVKEFIENLEIDPTVIENIGGKVEIYRGLSSMFVHEMKTLQGSTGIIVEDVTDPSTQCDLGGDFVNIRIDTDWLDEYICERIQACGGVTPPAHIITTSDIVINLSNGANYTFQAQDFLSHFNDSYATHQLTEIQLVSNTDNMYYQGSPYVPGTWIPLANISALVFQSPNTTGTYTQIIPWKGKDNLGNIST